LTQPTATHRFEDNQAVDTAQDIAAPNLAAIQHSYEDAQANIVDPFPETEKIDVRTVQLPAVPDGTPETEAMSVAARFLAEELASEKEQLASRTPALPESPPATSTGRRHWWRGMRSARRGTAPGTSPDA